MGHRKYSAPRRGSLAYLPRADLLTGLLESVSGPNTRSTETPGIRRLQSGTSHVTIVDNRRAR